MMGSMRQATLAETWHQGGGSSNIRGAAAGSTYGNYPGRGSGFNNLVSSGRGSETGRFTGRQSDGGSGAKKSKAGSRGKSGRGGRGRGKGKGNFSKFTDDGVTSVFSDDDEELLQAVGQFELAESEVAKAFAAGQDAISIPGFDHMAGATWIYPTNRPIRDYQFHITQNALFNNTMVSLPTGLGKTFIAAVVMYNFYRWYPNDIIVFMAPTRPLVTQQLDACHNIVGINPAVTVELTGQILPSKRQLFWEEKRVFFLTPQVMQSDISRNFCNVEKVRCIVIDEAHKALGNHSYGQVISAVVEKNKNFRVLALSATPGNDSAAIQQVFKNLLISHVELRSETSKDVLPYVHERDIETRVVSLDPFQQAVHEQIKDIFQIYTGKLMQQKILPRNASTFVAFQLLQHRQRFRTSPPAHIGQHERGFVEVAFSTCISLARAIDLLNVHGLRSFYSFLQGLFLREKGSAVVASELRKKGVEVILKGVKEKLNISVENSSFNISASGLFDSLNESGNPTLPQLPSSNVEDYLQSHPKLRLLKDIVEKHFETYARENKSTRIMIFSQYRDSVQEIGNLLNLLQPLVKPMVFMGQAKTAGSSGRGLKQKEQLQVVEKFKQGGFNVLVATSVGEEGLDIGDVDLIICFDSNKSPTRNIQRMGRTGRQREGKIVFLLTEGREERMYRASISQQSSIQRNFTDPNKLKSYLLPVTPRMVPKGVEPQCFKMNIMLSTEHKNYPNKQQQREVSVSSSEEEITLDDSDFIRPSSLHAKTKKGQGTGKTKRKNKNTGEDPSTKKSTKLHTITRCFEIMESKKERENLQPDTIVLDEDEFTLYPSPAMEVDHHSHLEDGYDLLCNLFDVQDINADTIAPPCVFVPLQAQKVSWEPVYNSVPAQVILCSNSQLSTVRELVDATIYLNSIGRYCNCGNGGNEENSLVSSFDHQNNFHLDDNSVELSCREKSPVKKKTPLLEIQPTVRSSLFLSPFAGVPEKGKRASVFVSTSTPKARQVMTDSSKNFINPTDAVIVDDFVENDPFFDDDWTLEVEDCAATEGLIKNVNSTVPNAVTSVEAVEVKQAAVQETVSCNTDDDDSTTASECDFFTECPTTNVSIRSSKTRPSAQDIDPCKEGFAVGSSVAVTLKNHSALEKSGSTAKTQQQSKNPTSPDLGIKRKFTFKKFTSTANSSSFDPIINETICVPQNAKSVSKITPQQAGEKGSRFVPPPARPEITSESKHLRPKIYPSLARPNAHEMFSRVLDDNDIDCIPGTSSEEEDEGKSELKLKSNNNRSRSENIKTNSSDATDWEPDEFPPTPPDPSLSKSTFSTQVAENNFVFSPERRNFTLSKSRSTPSLLTTKLPLPKNNAARSKQSIPVLLAKTKTSPVPVQSKGPPSKFKETFLAKCKELSQTSSCTSPVNTLVPGIVPSYTRSKDMRRSPEIEFVCSVPKRDHSSDSSSTRVQVTPPPVKKFKFTAKASKPSLISQNFSSPTTSKARKPATFFPPSRSPPTSAVAKRLPFSPKCPSPSTSFKIPTVPFVSPIRSPIVPRSNVLATPGSEGDLLRYRKRTNGKKFIIESDESPVREQVTARTPLREKRKMKKGRRNPFLLDEAAGTSGDSSLEDFEEMNSIDDSFVVNGDDDDEEEDGPFVSATQQQAMYLQSVKDIIPNRLGGRIEDPLPREDNPWDDDMEYFDDSFCDDEVEYADVGVFTQCMNAAREAVDREKKDGKSSRKLRSRR